MADIKPVPESKPLPKPSSAAKGSFTAPYFDLDSSIKVADVVYNRGGGACTGDQLAHWLDYKSVRSGTYLTRVSAANKHFGLVEQEGDRFVVTERAKKILAPVMPEDAITAKLEAFLAVPLFAKVFEQFRGSQIPHEPGLKNLFQNTYKLLPDRVPQAIRVLLNSAAQAGILTADRTRLVKPAIPTTEAKAPPVKDDQSPAPEKQRAFGGGGGDGPIGGVDSAIAGLLRKLPPPGPWGVKEKARFKDAFIHTIDFLYPDEEPSP